MTLALLIIIAVAFTFVAWRAADRLGTDAPLQLLSMLNMVLITLFGGVLFSWADYSTNCGNVWYADVMLTQWLVMRRFGWRNGLRAAASTFVGLLMLLLITAVLQTQLSDSPLDTAYGMVIDASRDFTVASFMAFWLGQGVLITIYRACDARPLWLCYGVAIAAAQAVDSAVFFPIAFSSFDISLLHAAAAGFVVKVGLGLLAIPALARIGVPRGSKP